MPDPDQVDLPSNVQPRWFQNDFEMRGVAEFEATVVVLGSREYLDDDMAFAAPIDLAVGWGPLGDPDFRKHFKVKQRNRWFIYRQADGRPRSEFIDFQRHAANWHIIPSDITHSDVLAQLKPGDEIRIRGYLVDVKGSRGSIRTSRSRTDTGAGACEVIRLNSIKLLRKV